MFILFITWYFIEVDRFYIYMSNMLWYETFFLTVLFVRKVFFESDHQHGKYWCFGMAVDPSFTPKASESINFSL